MRRFVLIAAIAFSACEDDPIGTGRVDTGVAAIDGGMDGPLALEPGMTFTYQGVMTTRPAAAVEEHNSTWLMTITIDTVDDQGAALSSLTFSASNPTTVDDDWAATDDFDSWVGRMGPSQTEDQLSTAPVTRTLDSPPAIPEAPQGGIKEIPAPGTFFLDMRAIDELRATFAQDNADLRPRVGDPTQNAGRWVFETSGVDPTVFYHRPSQERAIRLEYDPRGFLLRLDENLGDPNRQTPPFSTNRITLMSGP